ncbi:hypothetical protein CP973_13365 [Streptomyces albofaciens JCM 4342]|nr:hypothetical protein CP973_13365 [Streptomyces albofaciens JCM 4342]
MITNNVASARTRQVITRATVTATASAAVTGMAAPAAAVPPGAVALPAGAGTRDERPVAVDAMRRVRTPSRADHPR